ncbi:MAG: hypothetical protein PHE56_04030 [Bacteroidales bacterium]|nr:hypothetical protein [Bacteroidales bacterium]
MKTTSNIKTAIAVDNRFTELVLKSGLLTLFILIFLNIFSQKSMRVVYSEVKEIKNDVFHFRAYKGEELWIHIKPEIKNEKKNTRYSFNNVKLFRQNADDAFQYIIDKNDVEELSFKINVPSDGIYTLIFDRGGLKNFITELSVHCDIENVSGGVIERKAVMVEVPDTVHIYSADSVIYDYLRVCTPKIKQQRTPQYTEDQIFIDIAYALRIDNKYVIPVVLPQEILTDYKIAKSIEWGFTLSVGDEVYKALQKKVGQIATLAIDAGVGKAMSGAQDATGAVSKSQKAYEVFDKASTANAIAQISGDVGEASSNETVTVVSDGVQVITGFTALSDIAGQAIGSLVPKIEDQVIYKIFTQPEYEKYIAGQPCTALMEGKNGFAKGKFEIRDHRMNYYIVIENERSTGGGFWDVAESIGKTILSQYVYTNVKVFVKRKVEVTYDKGFYETSFYPLYNPKWNHSENITSKTVVMFEEELKPQYKILNTTNIY